VNDDTLILPDAVSPVRGLVFHSRVPPTVKVYHMIGSCQIETGAPGLKRQDHERNIVFSVKLLHQLLAGLYMYTAVND
jgi:hypothetical protein